MAKTKTVAGRESGYGAGVLPFCPETGRILLLKRSDQGDMPGTWCSLGGGVEQGEELHEAARREAEEEGGFGRDEECDMYHMCCIKDPESGFEFHNFLGIVPQEFRPALNDEHTEYMWADPRQLPNPMHPGLHEALRSENAIDKMHQHIPMFSEVWN